MVYTLYGQWDMFSFKIMIGQDFMVLVSVFGALSMALGTALSLASSTALGSIEGQTTFLEFGWYIYPARAVGFVLSGFLVGQVFVAGAVCASKHC